MGTNYFNTLPLRLQLEELGKCRFMAFVNAGIDAMITEAVIRSRKNSIGYWRYVLPVLRVLAHYHGESDRG